LTASQIQWGFTRAISSCRYRYEADADRAFYDEINRRLQDQDDGIEDALFVNAQNWQTIARIATPLRRLGIPAAAIMDLDVLCEGQHWERIYNMMNLNPTEHAAMEQQRATCEAYLRALPRLHNKPAYKGQGVAALKDEQQRAEVERLIRDLAAHGVFVLSTGNWSAGYHI
jgi:hypothetical protein